MRLETDLLGVVEIEKTSPHGAQTQRMIDVYPTTEATVLGNYPLLIQAVLEIKKSCLVTNIENQEIDVTYGNALIATLDDLMANLETYAPQYFKIHAYHGGGGVGINMIVNEIVANLTNKAFFQKDFGSYSPIHPNNHVNLNHSTSDLLKTAINITLIRAWETLKVALNHLEGNITEFILKYGSEPKISRTCLQDAVEITYGDFFSGYLVSLQRHYSSLQKIVDELYEVNMGGNIIGRMGDCSPLFFEKIIHQLRLNTGIANLTRAENLFEASQNNDLFIQFASGLSQLSGTLIRISKDLRLMSSGPETGLCEVTLPAVQQGSSAMPGKINPTIPEYMIQTSFEVIGICHGVMITQMHDELDYSPWQTFIVIQLLDALKLLSNSIEVFSRSCIKGIIPNTAKNQQNLDSTIPIMVQLMKKHGYADAVKIYKECGGSIEDIKSFL